jgi:hypothetical protein
MAFFKQAFGNEVYAYWQFFDREDASAIIEKNVSACQPYLRIRVIMSYQIDSFIQLLYPKDPESWNPYMIAAGKTAEWLENNMTPGFADYLNEEVWHWLSPW